MEAVETEAHTTRFEIAGYLRGLADQLESGGPVTLQPGGPRVSLDPVDPVAFGIEAESEPVGDGGGTRQRIQLELSWWTRSPGAQGGAAGRPGGWRAQQQAQRGRTAGSGQYQSQQFQQARGASTGWQQQQQSPGGYQQQNPGWYRQQPPGGHRRR